MPILLGIVGALILFFSIVLLRGAPYLPTLTKQVETALDLVDLKPGDTLLELGCGDGKVLIAAAKRGWNVVGYELNPLLALIAWLRTLKYKGHVRVVWGDFWNKQWPPHQAIFVFLLDPFMQKLDTKIIQSSSKPVKLVSFAFQIPSRKPKASKDGLFVYEYK
ncbi:MAG: hypothetical protein JWP13_19 [Candidatus Saccharibacteria bacterium]|nr:hypothetical protein [Candidatus Saccharibacteria bacterium]